jgi:hypothetical protein
MSVFRADNSPATDWTVPAQRMPHPMDAQFPDTDSPTQPLPQFAYGQFGYGPEPGPRWGVVAAVAIASVALVVALGASLATTRAAARSTQKTATPPPSTPGPAVPYVKEPLRVRVACGGTAVIDLDRPPRLGAPDLRFDNHCGSSGMLLSAGPGALGASHVPNRYLDRAGCAEAISADPLDADEGVPVLKGTVLCVTTGATLALVEVTQKDPDGEVSLRATGWTTP